MWIGESGQPIAVNPNAENGICMYAIEKTAVALAEAMRRADQTINQRKDNK